MTPNTEHPTPPPAVCYVLADDLTGAVGAVRPFAAKSSSIPILNNIALLARSDRLTVAATTLDVWALVDLFAAVDPVFAATVPARSLVDVLAKATAGIVDLEADPTTDNLRLDVGGRIVDLVGLYAGSFPCLPAPGATVATYDARAWADAVRAVVPGAATDDTRPALTCIHWDAGGLTTANGFRIEVADLVAPDMPTVLVDAKGADRIADAIVRECKAAKSDLTLTVSRDANPAASDRVVLTCGRLTFAIRDQSAEHADRHAFHIGIVRDLDRTRSDNPTVSTCDARELGAALKSAAVFARDAGAYDHRLKHVVTLRLNGSLDVHAEAPDIGNTTLMVDHVKTGPDIDLLIRGDWLRAIVARAGRENVTLECTTADKPVRVRTLQWLSTLIMPFVTVS